jgi:hypothetical protein
MTPNRTPVESTLTRWRHRQTGRMLVAIAVKRDEASMVLPIQEGVLPHVLDWMPESSFLRLYEDVPPTTKATRFRAA